MHSILNFVMAQLGATSAWRDRAHEQGRLTALYREYAEGKHRAELTAEMRKMLRVSDTRLGQFNLNYCDTVIATMADRLTLTAVEGENDAASGWAAALLADNRIDALQLEAHEAALRDGTAYLMVEWDNAARRARLAAEPAWDGESGMLAVPDRTNTRLRAAAKVFWDDARRVNLYYPDRVEKYVEDGEALRLVETAAWLPGRLPVTAMHNRSRLMRGAMSEIAAVIPIQDALNRTLVSMVMTAELSAFQIRVAEGFNPPANLSPGMWVVIGGDGLTAENHVKAYTMEQAQLVPFISQAEFLINQIAAISRTPLPGSAADTASGEALKQREIGLLGKVRRAQTAFGNAWEDAVALAARVQAAYGSAPPATGRWYARWAEAQVRNNTELIDNALKVADRVDERTLLELMAPAFGWDAAKIEAIMGARGSDQAARLRALAQGLPDFSGFELGDEGL